MYVDCEQWKLNIFKDAVDDPAVLLMKEIYQANHNKWYSAVSQCTAVGSSQNMTRKENGQGTS
jgi:hypothetical protein